MQVGACIVVYFTLMKKEPDTITTAGRTLHRTTCSQCGKAVYRRKSQIANGDKFTCSRKCWGHSRMTGKEVPCTTCGKLTYKQPSALLATTNHFCSLTCASTFNNSSKYADGEHPNYTTGYGSYRARALKHYGHKCMNPDCKLANLDIDVKMLDVDHINNNRSDNKLENLRVLCVWCHAEKTRKIS